jgi:O-antigen/teichoic acid export membrane protein
MFKNAQIRNILWMFIDKAFLLVGSFIVSVMVARYLGPEKLGFISYGLALGALAISIAQWGANYTIFDTAAKKEKRSSNYIISTEWLRLCIYVVVYLLLNIWLFFYGKYNKNDYILISSVLLSQVFLALDVYQFHYNAILKSRINATSSMVAKLISMSMRLYFAINQMHVFYFIIPFYIEGAIIYFLRRRALGVIEYSKYKKYSMHYFNIGLPLVVTGVCVVIYTKINEVMIGNLVSYQALGIYSIAVTINYAWTFFPTSIGISLLSKPLQEKNKKMKEYGFSFVTMISLVCSIPMIICAYLFPEQIIRYTFGVAYGDAKDVLFIISLASLLGLLGFLTNRMINSELGGSKFLLKKVIASSALMIPISYIFVSKWGLQGAAYSFLIAELFNLTFFNYLFENKVILNTHKKIISSFRYFDHYKY